MDLEGLGDILIPLTAILSLPIAICVGFYIRYRSRKEVQQTLRTAIEQGQQLTPEMLERLGGPQTTGNQDLRRGIITAAVGVGLIVFSFIHTGMGEDGAVGVRAGGFMVLVIGLAFLGLWYFTDGRRR